MKNEEFINNLNKDFFILYGSYVLKQQNIIQRECNDIDIYIRYSDIEYFEFLSKKYEFEIIGPGEVEVGPYGQNDFILSEFIFNDGSKIGLFLVDSFDNIEYDEFGKKGEKKLKTIKVKEILKGKIKRLLDNFDLLDELSEKQILDLCDLRLNKDLVEKYFNI